MKKQKDRNLEFVDRIINIISLEKGLSKNTKYVLMLPNLKIFK